MNSQSVNRNDRINKIRKSLQASNSILSKNHDLVADRIKRGYKIGETENSESSA